MDARYLRWHLEQALASGIVRRGLYPKNSIWVEYGRVRGVDKVKQLCKLIVVLDWSDADTSQRGGTIEPFFVRTLRDKEDNPYWIVEFPEEV